MAKRKEEGVIYKVKRQYMGTYSINELIESIIAAHYSLNDDFTESNVMEHDNEETEERGDFYGKKEQIYH